MSLPGLVVAAAWMGAPGDSLVWCGVFLLAGSLLIDQQPGRSQNLLLLAAGAIGVIALPFLPAWSALSALDSGLSGFLLAGAYGIAAGDLLGRRLSRLLKNGFSPGPLILTSAVGTGCLVLTLYLIAFSSGLVLESIGLNAYPLAAWIPLPGLAGALLARLRLPFRDPQPIPLEAESRESTPLHILGLGRGVVDRVIALLSGLFEGEGGLIWALLIAFLLLTLLGQGGG